MTGFQSFGFITLLSTVGIVVVCFVLYLRIMRKRHFMCQFCGQRFKVSGIRTFFAFNNSADKVLTCPYCGKSGLMQFKHDEDIEAEEAAKAAEIEDAADEAPSGSDGEAEK